MDKCAESEATKAGISSVQDKISSLEARMRSIESELGITSKNVVGNTSHPQYDQLQQQLLKKESTLLSLNEQLSSLIKLQVTLLAKDQGRGESSVMGGYNQFAELVLTLHMDCRNWL